MNVNEVKVTWLLHTTVSPHIRWPGFYLLMRRTMFIFQRLSFTIKNNCQCPPRKLQKHSVSPGRTHRVWNLLSLLAVIATSSILDFPLPQPEAWRFMFNCHLFLAVNPACPSSMYQWLAFVKLAIQLSRLNARLWQ